MSTTAEKLAAVENAIDTFIARGAVRSYTADGITVTREGLPTLCKYRDQLRKEVAAGKVHGLQLADLGGGD